MILALHFLFSLGLSRYSLGLNEEIESALKEFDTDFSSGLKKLKAINIFKALDMFANWSGYIAIFYSVLFLIGLVVLEDGEWKRSSSLVITYAAVLYVSIKWYTNFYSFALKTLMEMIKPIVGILALPLVDILTKSKYTSDIYLSAN